MKAKIYKPAKTAMQSGVGNTKDWILVFEPENGRFIDPIMGWTGSTDMTQEVKLRFANRDEAIAYAKKNNIPAQVIEPKTRKIVPKSYAENFS